MNDAQGKIRCWNSEGVWGDSVCPKLSSALHCANCEVYADAGREIFEREIPKDYFKTWGDAVGTLFVAEKVEGESYFAFECANVLYALPSSAVSELITPRMIHKIPHRRDGAIVGLVNINGELVVAVDIPSLFSYSARLENPKCILVCSSGNEKFAFPVDFARGSVVPDVGTVVDADVSDAWYVAKKFKFKGERVILIDFEILIGAIAKKRI